MTRKSAARRPRRLPTFSFRDFQRIPACLKASRDFFCRGLALSQVNLGRCGLILRKHASAVSKDGLHGQGALPILRDVSIGPPQDEVFNPVGVEPADARDYWIPAFAGMTSVEVIRLSISPSVPRVPLRCHPGLPPTRQGRDPVAPAGVRAADACVYWIPAFAGMTNLEVIRLSISPSVPRVPLRCHPGLPLGGKTGTQ